MLPNHLLQRYVFHMYTTTGNNMYQTCYKSSNGKSAECPAVYMAALCGSHLSILTDWMDRIDTPRILNIPTAKNLLVLDLEIMETCNVC
ncbi:hypothetical protein NPIL_352651 [Nephila pilipes]|uniref:Uncharacterized protein n=1 Tax=Nephila pilipes TaxID=299642 RepID=A0A8X6PFD7_NEPPI|nr:hypothetical protein NPIL_352651 [Nephila pilipes]